MAFVLSIMRLGARRWAKTPVFLRAETGGTVSSVTKYRRGAPPQKRVLVRGVL